MREKSVMTYILPMSDIELLLYILTIDWNSTTKNIDRISTTYSWYLGNDLYDTKLIYFYLYVRW